MDETEGVAGVGFTVTGIVPAAEVHPFSVIVTLYVPASANVAAGTDGFCDVDAKLFGPVHDQVAPATNGVFRLIGSPVHTGEFEPATGMDGVVFTTTETVPSKDTQPFSVTVTL